MSEDAAQGPQEVVVRKLGSDGAELAVFEFEGKLRETMIASLRSSYLATGSYASNAQTVSPQAASSIGVAVAAAGATALSASFSSSLFMATANPATLMSIGSGVGSAVMGAGGIVAQAPFIAVASSLPVVAPLMVMQALSTAVMMREFKKVDRKLDIIKSTLDQVLARIEATHAGELLAASHAVDDVYRQYVDGGDFSTDMLIRLGIAERDVRALTARFTQLVHARESSEGADLAEIQRGNYDAHSAMLASFVELRIAYLRVGIDVQENPRSVQGSMEHLKEALDDSIQFWQYLQGRSRLLKERMAEVERKLQEMNWRDRNLPGSAGAGLEKELEKLKAAYTATMESERDIMSDFHTLIESAHVTRSALESPNSFGAGAASTLVYWRDEMGEHSFVTDQPVLT
ncbi:hypothetical protein [Pseudoclavibacter helvolus]|uniref:hypothetical protein n=1 Tax=Pseudoclavibacter helvolus TaxID=255205 RepID=UPI0024AD7E44|nr:hypothetical protein [Pseudoclavibacter helvolus]